MNNSAEKQTEQEKPFTPLGTESEELVEISRLLIEVWPEAVHLSPRYLSWLYNENPNGTAFGSNLWEDGKVVAHYAAIPVVATLHGKKLEGLLSLNSAVAESHRGKSLFKKLAIDTYQQAKAAGLSFVVGVANQNSTLLFKRQLKFQIVGPLDVSLGFGYVEANNSKPDFQMEYSEETYNWRLSRPHSHYSRSLFRSNIVYANSGKAGIQVQLGYPSSYELPVKSSVFKNPISMWMGLGAKKRLFELQLPDKYKPSPLNLIYKPLDDTLQKKIDPHAIHFSALDFDAY